MDKYVLDTNLFFNMEPGLGLGKKTEDVIGQVSSGIKKLKESGKAEFYMPPRVVDELLSFFDNKEQSRPSRGSSMARKMPSGPFLKDFLSVVTIKSPDVSKVSFPASVFYELVSDIRTRSYRGLQLSEEELTKAFVSATQLQETSAQARQKAVGPYVKTLRDRYRQATRFGFLDSVADLDLIVLAKELDGYLVSTDEGVMKWGRTFGVREIEPSVFGKKLSEK